LLKGEILLFSNIKRYVNVTTSKSTDLLSDFILNVPHRINSTTVCLHRTTSCITCDNNVHTKQRKADKMEKVCILKTE